MSSGTDYSPRLAREAEERRMRLYHLTRFMFTMCHLGLAEEEACFELHNFWMESQ